MVWMLRLIGKLLVLVAVLLMPLGMPAAPAAASHQSSSATAGMRHCPEQAPSHHSKSGFAECTMACSAALPAMDRPQEDYMPAVCGPTSAAASQIRHEVQPEIATPPPKAS